MRLLNKLFGRFLPPPGEHIVKSAMAVCEHITMGRELRFIDSAYDPGAWNPKPIKGYWPLIISARLVTEEYGGQDETYIVLELEEQTFRVVASLQEELYVAPA